MAALIALISAGETDDVSQPFSVVRHGCCQQPAHGHAPGQAPGHAANVTVVTKQPDKAVNRRQPTRTVVRRPTASSPVRAAAQGRTLALRTARLEPGASAADHAEPVEPALPPAQGALLPAEDPAAFGLEQDEGQDEEHGQAPGTGPARDPGRMPETPPDPDLAAGPDGPSTGIDARMARTQIAATVIGALSQRSRPSQLLGKAASGSLLASTADAYWGLGAETAMQLIVEGKPPELQRIATSALRITAAAANQNVAELVDDATQFGKDHAIPFLRNLELEADWSPGNRPRIAARTIDSLFESAALEHTLFLQASVTSDFADTTANVGLGYRYMVPDSRWMLGVNAFYDEAFPLGHQRMSLGVEAATDDFTLFANRYMALSGWTEKNADYQERPLSGWDLGIAGEMPGIEDLSVSLAAVHWEREAHPDKTGFRLTADYDVSPALQLGGTFSADDHGNVQAGFRLTYQFGADQFGGGGGAGLRPLAERRLDFVNRENQILTEKRKVPRNYAVSFGDSAVTAENQSALAVNLAGAPPGARYSYTIVSSGGGTPVTGGGRVDSDPQLVSGIDVSGLPDGTLTLTLHVTSRDGARGAPVTAQIVKSIADLGVSTAAATPNPTNANPIGFTIRFSQAVTDFELPRLAVTNGTAANLTTTDRITWTVDVTPAGQGEVTLEVPAGAAVSGAITNSAASRASVVYDSLAPAGYAVSFLAAPFEAAGFEITGGEAGSSYSYTISSSAGGSPVSGSGVMGAQAQQVTGLDLTGLADGTLTLSVTLSDALGNAGSPATATTQKDTAGPVILAVTPPAAGDYDDL